LFSVDSAKPKRASARVSRPLDICMSTTSLANQVNLRRYRYPPDEVASAVNLVLQQAETLGEELTD